MAAGGLVLYKRWATDDLTSRDYTERWETTPFAQLLPSPNTHFAREAIKTSIPTTSQATSLRLGRPPLPQK